VADFKVTGEAEISPDKIVEDVDAIISKLDKLAEKINEIDDKLDELSRKSVNIDIVLNGMDRLDELKLFLEDLDSKEYIVKVVIGDVIGNDRLDALRADLDELTLRDHKVNVKIDVDGMVRARAAVDALNTSLGKNKKAVDQQQESSPSSQAVLWGWRPHSPRWLFLWLPWPWLRSPRTKN
jgi:50S ribosomal subunit-associated GTPase HflX